MISKIRMLTQKSETHCFGLEYFTLYALNVVLLQHVYIIGVINQWQNIYIVQMYIFHVKFVIPSSQHECSNSVHKDSVFWRRGRGRHSCGSSIQYQQLGSERSAAEGRQHFFKWIDTAWLTFKSDKLKIE